RRRRGKEIRAFAFSAKPFLQIEEGQLLPVLESHDFAVENHFIFEIARRVRKLGKLLSHSTQIARERFHPFCAPMRLGANAVKLVFHEDDRFLSRGCREPGPDCSGGRFGSGQHYFDRSKKGERGTVQSAPGG